MVIVRVAQYIGLSIGRIGRVPKDNHSKIKVEIWLIHRVAHNLTKQMIIEARACRDRRIEKTRTKGLL